MTPPPTITTHWPIWVCDVLLTKLVWWLLDVLLPSMVNGCSYSSCWHVGYWMLCWPWWLLNVLLTLVVFGYSVNSGYWTFLTSINKKPVKNKTLRQNSWFKFSHWNFAFICNNIPAAFAFGIHLLSWCGIPELMDPIRVSVIDGCC